MGRIGLIGSAKAGWTRPAGMCRQAAMKAGSCCRTFKRASEVGIESTIANVRLSAIPRAEQPAARWNRRIRLQLEVPAVINLPAGTGFHLRRCSAQRLKPGKSRLVRPGASIARSPWTWPSLVRTPVTSGRRPGRASSSDAHATTSPDGRLAHRRLKQCPFDQSPAHANVNQFLVGRLSFVRDIAMQA